MDCYIYYRSATAHSRQVSEQAGKLQLLLSQLNGVATELKRRPQSEDDIYTWMEVYRGIPADFEAQMEAALQQTALPSLIQGKRHAEYFMDVAPCA